MGKTTIIDKDHGWKDLVARAKALNGGISVRVGILGDTTNGGLHKRDAGGKSLPLTLPEIAAVQEFGTRDGRIPARSFIAATFDKMRGEIQGNIDTLIARVLFGEVTADKAMSIIGLKLATAMKKRITSGPGIPPPNAASTIRAKGSDRPLVDTGRLVGSITYAVDHGENEGQPQTVPGSK